MRLFVGLGNPGPNYAKNRHNIGYMAVDRIAAAHHFAPFRAKFQGRVSEGMLGSEKVILLKPETFMNRSGQSVAEAAKFYRIPADRITVFHDELDLAPGKVRLKMGGGHAGHNGLRSIHAHLGDGYGRVRLGIGHPGDKDRVAGYVLSDFAKAELDWLDNLLRGVGDGAAALAEDDSARFLNAVAVRVSPPRASTGQKPAATPENGATPPAPAAAEDRRSPLQRLADRFR